MSHPLDDVTGVALDQAVAAPLATRGLADLGTRVIEVERVDGGNLARGDDHVVYGIGAHFVWLNRGKESLPVEIKNDNGRAVVCRLDDRAEVFLQNLAPGAAERLRFGAAELRPKRPELIVVNLFGYGSGGPLEHRKAYDKLVPAEAGLTSITGTPETSVTTGIPTADIASEMYCAQAILAALLRRSRTGEGSTIEVSMLEATVKSLGHALYTQLHTGSPPPRMGLSHSSTAPYDAFPTRDGEVLTGVQSDSGRRALVTEAAGAPELAEDPRFATDVQRIRRRSECDALVAARTIYWSTAALDVELAAAGIPVAQVKESTRLPNTRNCACVIDGGSWAPSMPTSKTCFPPHHFRGSRSVHGRPTGARSARSRAAARIRYGHCRSRTSHSGRPCASGPRIR
ncbi:CaiB/BaiF CoA transferase family protein [Nocardia sp. NPDC059246]|uniref:CaiB/BaiF CoA transferase family protein n=1 Tax=unclassified Nocardia TaxID=2637762 RepID=UPI0036B28DCA